MPPRKTKAKDILIYEASQVSIYKTPSDKYYARSNDKDLSMVVSKLYEADEMLCLYQELAPKGRMTLSEYMKMMECRKNYD